MSWCALFTVLPALLGGGGTWQPGCCFSSVPRWLESYQAAHSALRAMPAVSEIQMVGVRPWIGAADSGRTCLQAVCAAPYMHRSKALQHCA